MDGFTPMDYGSGSPISEDPFSPSALMNFDNHSELCSPSTTDQVFSLYGYSEALPMPGNWASFASSSAHGGKGFGDVTDNARDKLVAQKPSLPFEFLSSSHGKDNSVTNRTGRFVNFASNDDSVEWSSVVPAVPRSIRGVSLEDKMLRALSLFKETSGGGILAQFWMPVKHGDEYVLSTKEQPFLLDEILAGYREISRAFTFSPKEAPGLFPGLPGRVFMSGMPEWTSNVVYYNRLEYLRVDHARNHEVRGSLAVPVFDPHERSCCAVLELVTTKEKADFDMEMDSVCNALQAVELRTIKCGAHQQSITKNQNSAFTEISNVLRAACHAHMLPLALTWTPFFYDDESTDNCIRDVNSNTRKKSMLCIHESACYVNDIRMQGFLHACAEHCLEKGQGTAGKALQSNQPSFSADVKRYDIQEYPLAHHARKFGLHAAVAIRLRSTYTGDDDYILEFFLPVNCKGSAEQQVLLDNLSNTMQRISRSLRTVSGIHKEEGTSSPSIDISVEHPQGVASNNELRTEMLSEKQNRGADERGVVAHEQLKSGSPRQLERKRSTAEKNISLSVLQQYFSGSLKDAAKSIGVCPTTLKRICRQHGISRWPSRKINKVNRSLKKIQTVINSVHGVEGALKYDPATGCLVAAVSSSEKPVMITSEPAGHDAAAKIKQLGGKLEPDDCSVSVYRVETSTCVPPLDCSNELWQQPAIIDAKLPWPSNPKEGLECRITSISSIVDEMSAQMDADDGVAQNSLPSSSSMTDSSGGSASSVAAFRLTKASADDCGSTITVKATYKEDTVRFKILPPVGCNQLYKEISKRFKLSISAFQLKYMDDEDEWVMLASDSDLQECIELLGSTGSYMVRLLVRDVPPGIASSFAG